MGALGVVFVAVWVARFFLGPVDDGRSEPDAEGWVEVFQSSTLAVGDCVSGMNDMQVPRAVPCADPHDGEVFASVSLDEANWPGEARIREQASDLCERRWAESKAKYKNAEFLDVNYFVPSEHGWINGDRAASCLAVDLDGKLTGSIRTD